MMAKIIVWDENRVRAIQKMLKTLEDTILFGVKSNIPLLKQILNHPEFVDGSFNTQFFNQHFSQGAQSDFDSEQVKTIGELCTQKLSNVDTQATSQPSPFSTSWSNV